MCSRRRSVRPGSKSLGAEAERIHADWLHRPGNLTLSAYNQELWNHPFKVKRERYAQSNIVLTRELADSSAGPMLRFASVARARARRLAHLDRAKEQVARPESDNGDDEEGPGRAS